MLGFLFDIIVLLTGLFTSYYFFHKESNSNKNYKSKLFGILVFALCIAYGYISYVKNFVNMVVSVPSIRILYFEPKLTIGNKVTIDVYYENSGNTPIKSVTIYSSCVWHTVPYTDFTLYKNSKTILNDFSIKEQRILSLPTNGDLTKEVYRKILNDSIIVYAYARFSFLNESNVEYSKEFCVRYNPKSKRLQDVPDYKFINENN